MTTSWFRPRTESHANCSARGRWRSCSLGGKVFECAYARLPEGCGKTIHCSECTIRRAVSKTYETGEPQRMVPATLIRELPGNVSTIAFSITTMKAGDFVMLQVEKFGI